MNWSEVETLRDAGDKLLENVRDAKRRVASLLTHWNRYVDNFVLGVGETPLERAKYYRDNYQILLEEHKRNETELLTHMSYLPGSGKVVGAPGLNIGLGVCITRGDKFLVSQRLPACKIGVGVHAMPGGSFQYGESILECMRREAKEETGLDILPVLESGTPVFHVQEWDREGMRIITLYTHAHLMNETDEPVDLEPTKHTPWRWVRLSEMVDADPSWIPVSAFVKNYYRLFEK